MSMDHADEADSLYRNIIHASATEDEAEKELEIWFSEDQLHEYQNTFEQEVR